jgi:hypothetical protein
MTSHDSSKARGIQYRQGYLDPMVLTTFREICNNDLQWKKKKPLGKVSCFSCNAVDDDVIIKVCPFSVWFAVFQVFMCLARRDV